MLGVFVLESALFTALMRRLVRPGRDPAARRTRERRPAADPAAPRAGPPGPDRAGDPAAGLPPRRPRPARPGRRQRGGHTPDVSLPGWARVRTVVEPRHPPGEHRDPVRTPRPRGGSRHRHPARACRVRRRRRLRQPRRPPTSRPRRRPPPATPARTRQRRTTDADCRRSGEAPAEGQELAGPEFADLLKTALDQATTAHVTMDLGGAGSGEGDADYTKTPPEMAMKLTMDVARRRDRGAAGRRDHVHEESGLRRHCGSRSRSTTPTARWARIGSQLDVTQQLEMFAKAVTRRRTPGPRTSTASRSTTTPPPSTPRSCSRACRPRRPARWSCPTR